MPTSLEEELLIRPMLMAFMFQIKINIDEGGRSSLSIMALFLEAKYPPTESLGTTKTSYSVATH